MCEQVDNVTPTVRAWPTPGARGQSRVVTHCSHSQVSLARLTSLRESCMHDARGRGPGGSSLTVACTSSHLISLMARF